MALITYGGIIGTVEIVDCVPVEKIADTLTERERILGDYSPGRFAWVLQNPVMFDCPIPARGKQGWWECPFIKTAECLEGENVYGKCDPEGYTSHCPWHPNENSASV